MRLKRKTPTSAVCGLVCASFLAAIASHGAVLIGNYPAADDLSGVLVTEAVGIAGGFTVGATPQTVTSVTLRLQNFSTTDGGANPQLGFYADNAGQPGTQLGNFLQDPSSSSREVGDFTFTSDGSVTLAANTLYWFQLDATDGGFNWNASSTGSLPSSPGGDATWQGYKFDLGTYFNTGTRFTFEVNATSVPEPTHIAFACGGALLAFAAVRRRCLDTQQRTA